jgi:hypothetical protein
VRSGALRSVRSSVRSSLGAEPGAPVGDNEIVNDNAIHKKQGAARKKVKSNSVVSYPADVTTWNHPDDPPPGFKVIRLWRFADNELRRVD